MATRARRSAHFAAVDAVTKVKHFACCAFRHGKCGHTCLWMRAFWRLRGHFNRIARRCCCAWTWRDVRGTALGPAPGPTTIDNPVDPSAYIVGNVERAVRSHSQATGTMCGFARRLHRTRETIRKYFTLAGCAVSRERLKNHVVAT